MPKLGTLRDGQFVEMVGINRIPLARRLHFECNHVSLWYP